MTTTYTSDFNLDLNTLIEEAFERCGQELRTGYDFRTSRRSLNLLTVEWANRGINLWTVEQGQITLNQGQIMYPLPVDTIDLLDMVTRTGTGQNQQDININRISESTYLTIPNKNATGRPIQVWINRQSGNTVSTLATLSLNINATVTTIPVSSTEKFPYSGFVQIDNEVIQYTSITTTSLEGCIRGVNNTVASSHTAGASLKVLLYPNINVWPAPDQSDYYTFVYYRLRRILDAGNGVNTQDIPFRFLTCMVAGLAYYLSMKLPDVDPGRRAELKADYEQQFQLAADEDREKASVRFVPREMFYHG